MGEHHAEIGLLLVVQLVKCSNIVGNIVRQNEIKKLLSKKMNLLFLKVFESLKILRRRPPNTLSVSHLWEATGSPTPYSL